MQEESPLDQIKAVYEDGWAEINGTRYEFTKMLHRQRLKVFGFQSSVSSQLENSDFSFLSDDRFEEIERLICDKVLVNGTPISKHPNFWDEHAGDYIVFIATAMGVISYPFLAASV